MTYKLRIRYRETNEVETVRVLDYKFDLAGVFLYFGEDELSFVPFVNLFNLDIQKES